MSARLATWVPTMNVTLHYDEPLVRRAVRRFCLRTIGWLYFAGLFAVGCAMALMLVSGERSWVIGAIGTILAIALAVPGLLYRNQLSGALARFRALDGKPASFQATDAMVTIRSSGGMAEFPWRTITGIWKYDDCWLLLMGGHFITFPLAAVSLDAQAYVTDRVVTNGGKVG
jgi:YcxB-like protein